MLESEAMKRIIALATLYPNTKTTPEMFDGYARMLKHLEPEVLNAACEMAALESENFFPSVGMILRLARTITEPEQLTAADGWALVLAEVRRIGIYDPPKFDHAITAKCVASIGWLAICNSEMEGVERAHFIKMFDQYSVREAAETRLLPAAKRLRELHNGNGQRLIG